MGNTTDFIESIAVVGMSGRFPGAKNVDQFWRNLRDGVESLSRYTDNELESQGVPPAVFNDPSYVKAESFLEDVEMFDAAFFGFSPREAEIIDPQHRIFLESAWEALENAGYDPETYAGPIGVYAGTSMNDYIFNLYSQPEADNPAVAFQKMIGIDKDYLTTRVSYKLNLKGPSLTVQTACSTSLVAVHLACQSLLNYQCDMTLAGGVCINLPQRRGYLYQEGMILSPDGHCRAFDAKAQGTVPGQGLGIVVLKRLSEALEDGDTIHAVIKGSAINNDGALKVGYTAPSMDGQAEVIAMALALAQIDPETITYIEAHGTGTQLGDPIEIAALTQAFRANTQKKGFCAIGSVKTNVGHLDAAAGVTGLIKTALALKHKEIPPSLHFVSPNPKIDIENSPFYVNNRLTEWHTNGAPRRAGVSSFGIGGTNAHAVLEEAPVLPASDKSRPYQLLLLSAKTSSALETTTKNLIEYFKQHPELKLPDAAYTLQVGRKAFSHRRMVVCHDRNDAETTLETLDSKRVITSFQEPINRDVVFMFSGQGAQYINMGLDLYKTESIFQAEIDHCSEILKPHLSLDIRELLYPDEQSIEEAAHKLKQTFITQPALFVIEYSLAKLWMQWGIKPAALIGHSIGEYVAACLSGVFSLKDALSLVAARGQLMQSLPGGSMLVVFLSEKELQTFLNENISLAAVNSPSICTVSGDKEDIEDLEEQFSRKNVDCRHLHTSHAFHSKMMDPILGTFTEQVKQIKMRSPQIPFLSNTSGTWITSEEAMDPDYWARHLRRTVRFSDCVQELLKEPDRVLLEIGPGQTLSTLAGQHLNKTKGQFVLSSIRHPKENKSDVEFILNTIGRLWLAGVRIDWAGFYSDEKRYRVPLPTYPFERKRYWIDGGKLHSVSSAETKSYEESEHIHDSFQSTDRRQKITQDFNAPGNETEQKVANIWRDVLGVDKAGINDDFFNLGGNSLIAVHMFAQIEKVFGKKLPLATLYELPTIEKLSRLLSDNEHSVSWDSLVAIQPHGSNPPLFFMHSEGGNVLEYNDLSRILGPDQPFYALQAQGLEGETIEYFTIEEMASAYIKEIKKVKHKGPYYLGGYCLGGLIAYEAARQLIKQGEEVKFLALVSTINPQLLKKTTPDMTFYHRLSYRVSERIALELNNISFLDFRAKSGYIFERIHKIATILRVKIEGLTDTPLTGLYIKLKKHSFAYNLKMLAKAHGKAFFQYQPRSFSGNLTLFRAGKQSSMLLRDPTLGWGELVDGEIRIYDIDAYHKNILKEPNVGLLAQKLKACLNETKSTDMDSCRV